MTISISCLPVDDSELILATNCLKKTGPLFQCSMHCLHSCWSRTVSSCYQKHFIFGVSQVYELHRLYRIQRLLMKTIGSSPTNFAGQIGRTGRQPRKEVDLESPAEDPNAESERIGALDTIDESQIELTLGPSSYNTMTSRSKKDDAQLSSSSFSSSSTGSSNNIVSSNRSNLVVEAAVNEEQLLKIKGQNHPPWIFRVLSLNSTWRSYLSIQNSTIYYWVNSDRLTTISANPLKCGFFSPSLVLLVSVLGGILYKDNLSHLFFFPRILIRLAYLPIDIENMIWSMCISLPPHGCEHHFRWLQQLQKMSDFSWYQIGIHPMTLPNTEDSS